MAKELSIVRTPDGYSLSSLAEKDSPIKYHQFLRGGTYDNLKNSLANLPEEFYKEGIMLHFNYGNESAPFSIPKDKREELEGIVEMLRESENIFD